MEFKEIFEVLRKIKNSTKSEYVEISTSNYDYKDSIRITAFKKGITWNQEYTKEQLQMIDKGKKAAKLDEDIITKMFIERTNFEYRKNDVY